MSDKKGINQQEISGRIPILESGSSVEIPKPAEQRAGSTEIAGQIQTRLREIKDGKAPAVDPTIMEAARNAAAAENGGSSSRENLRHLLHVLNGGSVDDPASTLDEVLATSSGEEIKD